MSKLEKFGGLYVITDDVLTPSEEIISQVERALKGGVSIVQLRDKNSSDDAIKQKVLELQTLCKKYDALFVLNDKIYIAIEMECDGLHIGKSDYDRFDEIRANFKGIIGVSCYGDLEKAKEFEKKGADYVAFGSFFHSPTKPNSNIVDKKILLESKKQLRIPVCAIGGINLDNIDEIITYKPDMISVISGIWKCNDITQQAKKYNKYFKENK